VDIYSTHLLVLKALGTLPTVRRVLELGAGLYSTPAFLDPAVYPHLQRMVSSEPNDEWRKRVHEAIGDHPTWTLTDTDPLLLAGFDGAGLYDLIFIDSGDVEADRIPVIRAVAAQKPAAIVVMHDFERHAYQQAAQGYDTIYVDNRLLPNTAVAWNGDRPDLDALARAEGWKPYRRAAVSQAHTPIKRVLIAVPQSRVIPASLESVLHLDTAGYEVDIEFVTEGDDPNVHRWVNVTRKYQRARRLCLDGSYDALLCIEDDQIVPPNALKRLDALQADIAYAHTVTRAMPHHWAATIVCGPADGDYVSYDMKPEAMREAWGKVVPVIGCGLYCTLIRRHVLEALDFELRGSRCCDFYFAYDAERAGFTQLYDTRLLCGHVMSETQVVYPDGTSRYRYEELVRA
jgi:hypothetical protein